jgi:hypothetical protein
VAGRLALLGAAARLNRGRGGMPHARARRVRAHAMDAHDDARRRRLCGV